MWSQDLQDRTRNALTTIEFASVMPDGSMPLKKFAKSPNVFGVIRGSDLTEGKYLVASRMDEKVWQYNTLDELISDGWATIDKKAETFWEKARNTTSHYQEYLEQKKDKFALSFTDLLYASNFKAGNGNVQEPCEGLKVKLQEFSTSLREFDKNFSGKSLGSLESDDLELFLTQIRNLIDLCFADKIDGFGVPYCSALFHFYFPDLIPVLDRRVLMGMKIVNQAHQMTAYGQVRNIETHYESLIRVLHKQLSGKAFSSLKEADKHYFVKPTPEHLKVKNLRSAKDT